VTTIFILASLYICIKDLQTHLITHRSIVLLAIPLISMYRGSSFVTFLITSLAASLLLLILASIANIGGGDIKLALLLIWLAPDHLLSTRYWSLFLAICFVQLLLQWLQIGFRNRFIPMAPAILLPLVAIHLGI
jgi:hypothetical protein